MRSGHRPNADRPCPLSRLYFCYAAQRRATDAQDSRERKTNVARPRDDQLLGGQP